MTDTQKISWTRLYVEAAVIVSSILLAFAIDAWWNDRLERVLEYEALVGLSAEFQDHKSDLSRQKARHLEYLHSIEVLVDACRQGDWESDETSLDEAVFALIVPETTDLGSGVLDTLISSGNIAMLSDSQLRYELAEWDSELDELVDDQQFNSGLVSGLVIPYLTRSGVSFSGPHNANPMKYWSLPTRYLSGDSEAMTKLCSDPEFISIVEARYSYMVHMAGEFDRVLSAIDRILPRIEASTSE